MVLQRIAILDNPGWAQLFLVLQILHAVSTCLKWFQHSKLSTAESLYTKMHQWSNFGAQWDLVKLQVWPRKSAQRVQLCASSLPHLRSCRATNPPKVEKPMATRRVSRQHSRTASSSGPSSFTASSDQGAGWKTMARPTDSAAYATGYMRLPRVT